MNGIYNHDKSLAGIKSHIRFSEISPHLWMDRDPFTNYQGYIDCKDARKYMFFKRGKIHQDMLQSLKNYLDGEFVDLTLLRSEWIIVLYGQSAICDDPQLTIITSSSPGTPRVYFSFNKGYLIWSTYLADLMSLLREFGYKEQMDPGGLNGYLQFLHQPSHKTLCKGALVLPPASVLKIIGNELSLSQHLSVSKIHDTKWIRGDKVNDKISQIKKLIDEVMTPQIADSDKKTGLLLSGGFDSSLLAGICKKKRIEVTSFTVGFEGVKDERAQARAVARHFKTKHKEIILTPKNIPHLLWDTTRCLGFPAANPSSLATYAVIEDARKEKIGRLLSGLGSDELFAGHHKHILARYWPLSSVLANMTRKGKNGDSQYLTGQPPKITRYIDLYTFFDTVQLNKLILSNYREKQQSYYMNLMGDDFQEEQFLIDIYVWLVDGLIPITTTIAATQELDLDLPFCKLEFLECARNIPLKMKVKGWDGKWVLKKAGNNLVPDWVLKRKRHGFTVPINQWLRGPLANLFDKYLGKDVIQKRGIFNSAEIQKMITAHIQGQQDLSLPLWGLIALEVWQRIFIDHEE
ncbi:MAG: asparagine synthetase B family protein [bacterium]